jgi:O-acetyl-ADP-ribose deacetylase (regulator of RNase III)
MIENATGNLLKADAEALVNTVNCVGFMGKGIALQFKRAYPDNLREYEKSCKAGKVVPGRMLVHSTGRLVNPRYIINFPTKRHWRGRSRIDDIKTGLSALINEVQRLGIRSIAVPPLGCGNGGLDWNIVKPLIVAAFGEVPDVRVLLYAPAGAPEPKTMPVGTKRPHLTAARALLVSLMEQYLECAYRLTLLEIQKLAYFLQLSGERLNLRYEAGTYGPYALNLNKVLEVLEGHFIRGLGDEPKPDLDIELLPGAADEARKFLQRHPSSAQSLARVSEIVEGFETPYGMELLSSVHWVATRQEPSPLKPAEVIERVHSWNERKRSMFRAEHIVVAWQHLRAKDFLDRSAELQ